MKKSHIIVKIASTFEENTAIFEKKDFACDFSTRTPIKNIPNRTDGQNCDSQDRASIAASRGKKHFFYSA